MSESGPGPFPLLFCVPPSARPLLQFHCRCGASARLCRLPSLLPRFRRIFVTPLGPGAHGALIFPTCAPRKLTIHHVFPRFSVSRSLHCCMCFSLLSYHWYHFRQDSWLRCVHTAYSHFCQHLKDMGRHVEEFHDITCPQSILMKRCFQAGRC